uniref:Vps16 N-terminal domain-containing protein n=1 Tax=Lygus hesperus TaxID=30085 RepID=A0A0K8T8X9_LYGHE
MVEDLAVSSNYEMLAILTNRGKLWIGSVDGIICRRICDVRFTSPQHTQMLWCGTDAVVINWGKSLDVFGLDEEYISYMFEDSVFCVQEIDCIRVISNHSMDLIQKVPQDVRDIFKYNSSSPGSNLLAASKQFQRKSHRANEYLLLVKANLFVAVMQCIDAAGHQFDVETQRILMKAAQFGKICLDDCSPENYVTMIRVLRCLNAIRHPKIGLPLTFNQLHTLTLQGLMELLMIRRHHFLALDLASFLKMPDSSKIQLHWACHKVQQSKEDVNKVAQEIKDKLGNTKKRVLQGHC